MKQKYNQAQLLFIYFFFVVIFSIQRWMVRYNSNCPAVLLYVHVLQLNLYRETRILQRINNRKSNVSESRIFNNLTIHILRKFWNDESINFIQCVSNFLQSNITSPWRNGLIVSQQSCIKDYLINNISSSSVQLNISGSI
jgi:hypothetical protein